MATADLEDVPAWHMLGHELRKLIVVICPYTPPQLLYAVYADAGRCTRKGRVDSAAQLSNNSNFGHYVLLIFVAFQ